MKFNELKKEDKKYVANTYNRFDLGIKTGIGSKFIDFDGKEYIDFTGGIGVNVFGATDQIWKEAITKQINLLQHTSNLFYTEPCVRLAKLLCEKTKMDKAFFCNSGAEANEGAIKAARKYKKDKYEIITLKNSFHGRTMATMSATGQDSFHKNYEPFLEGFKYATPNVIEDLDKLLTNKTCAVMIEVIQGEGGVVPLDKEYCLSVQEFCIKHDLLFIVDEVQSGNGRCGYFYAYMAYGLKPNIVTTAKGLGGGLPIGAIIFDIKTSFIFGYSDHASTFGGNPVVAAGAASIISRIDEELLLEVKRKGQMIKDIVMTFKNVNRVDGLGLMLGIVTTKNALDVVKECIIKGALFLTAKEKIRLLPSLLITDDEIKQGLAILKEVIEA